LKEDESGADTLPSPTHRRPVLVAVQVVLSVALLAYFILKADPLQALTMVRNADLMLLALAVLQLTLQVPLLAWRWELITASLGGPMPFLSALKYTWVGFFAAQLLPAVGGDAVRMWMYWRRESGGRRIAVHGVVLERVIMLVTLLGLVIAAQSGLAARGVPGGVLGVAWLLLACIAVAGGVVLFLARGRLHQSTLLPARLLHYAGEDLGLLRKHPRRTALALFLAIASYLNMAMVMWFIARALGLSASLSDCFVLTPLVVLAAMLPISLGGWGVREGAAIVLFGLVGLSHGEAFTLSALFGLCSVLISVPGGVLWLGRGTR
jgi:hypothetical protein